MSTDPDVKAQWVIRMDPVAENPSQDLTEKEYNKGGIIVSLECNGEKREVDRVAYVRKNARNPKVNLRDQLQATIADAQLAADTINRVEAEAMARYRTLRDAERMAQEERDRSIAAAERATQRLAELSGDKEAALAEGRAKVAETVAEATKDFAKETIPA